MYRQRQRDKERETGIREREGGRERGEGERGGREREGGGRENSQTIKPLNGCLGSLGVFISDHHFSFELLSNFVIVEVDHWLVSTFVVLGREREGNEEKRNVKSGHSVDTRTYQPSGIALCIHENY